MADLFENPVGLDGFEFIEFCAPEKGILEPVFTSMGFTKVSSHRSKDADLWRQGGINMIANYEPNSPAHYFAREHGPSACAMAFRVRDAKAAYAHLIAQGAEPVDIVAGPMELKLPAIKGIGGALIYLIDRYGDDLSIYDIDFKYLDGVDPNPVGAGFEVIDLGINNSAEEYLAAIEEYQPKNHRSQLLIKNGVSFFVDAYNANPSSMKVAVENLASQKNGEKLAILGHMLELGPASNDEHKKLVLYCKSLGNLYYV